MRSNKHFAGGHDGSKYPDSCSSCGGRTGWNAVTITNEEGTRAYHDKCAPPSQKPSAYPENWKKKPFDSKKDPHAPSPKDSYPNPDDREGPKKPPNDDHRPPAGGTKVKPKGPKSPIAPAANAKDLASKK